MNKVTNTGKPNAFGKILIVLVIMLTFIAAPAFGQIKSARARVLKDVGGVTTTKIANFGVGDILGTSLISITVNNGQDPAYLLMKLKIQLGGEWSRNSVEVSLVTEIGSNQPFTFTNRDMLKYTENIRKDDFKMSDTLVSDVGISDFNDIANLQSLKEGIYSISLTASEVTLATPGDINSTPTVIKEWIKETDASSKVEFFVVTIGDLANISWPEYTQAQDKLILSFQVPKIPVYNDANIKSTSTTRVEIDGPGINQHSITTEHKISEDTASPPFKGWPSDLTATDGYVTYYLSALNFRAGGSYSIKINFYDWNKKEITKQITKTINFPTPNFSAKATISADDPFRPEFSWKYSVTDYSPWTKEYRIYINGIEKGKTTGTEFKLSDPLIPSTTSPTTYTWYVMPINRDGSPFFAPQSNPPIVIKAHAELGVSINEPAANATLIKGETYSFIGTAAFSDGAEQNTASWKIGTETRTGTEVSYAPTRRYVSGSLPVSLTVKDTLNLTTTSSTINLTVLDPAIAIQGVTTRTVDRTVATRFSVDTAKTWDIATYAWFVNGTQVGTGDQLSYSFPDNGTYNVHVEGTTVADMLGMKKTVASPNVVVKAHSAVSMTALRAPATIYTDEALSVSVETTGDADGTLISTLTYSVDGRVYRLERTPAAKTISFTGLAAGKHTVDVTLVDLLGNSSSRSVAVNVYEPLQFAITQPTANAAFSPDTSVPAAITVSLGQYSSLSWSLDGTSIANSNFESGSLGRMSPGAHRISISARDLAGKVVTASVNITVFSDFQLSLIAPNAGTKLIIGNSVTAMVGLDKIAGSQVDLTDAARRISWFVDGRDTGKKGLTYIFTGESEGDQTIYARYEKEGMVRTTAERTITVRDIAEPTITKPTDGSSLTYAQGGRIVLTALGEPGASFSWYIDGNLIAMGADTYFNPNGMAGQKQLRLVTSAYGRSTEKLVSFTVAPNSAPILTLTAPAVQLTGDSLTWTASASDVEDQNTTPLIEIFFDGILQNAGDSRLLGAGDVGMHTLSAKATDSMGTLTSRQVSIRVDPKQLALQIQSPADGRTFYSGYDVPLIASLVDANPDVAGAGTFSWNIEYLDTPSLGQETFTGASAVFRPRGVGQIAITARYLDASGKERGTKRVTVKVEREALKLSIYWPHGSVVNIGDRLTPSLLGLPATAVASRVVWTLNDEVIDSIASLSAPTEAGLYTLAAEYSANGGTDRAEVGFQVNGRPKVTITNLVSGGQYVAGNPLVLAAKIEDDQPYSGTLTWVKQDGTSIGEGNPFILRDAAAGEWQIMATAIDKYGATASDTVQLLMYSPVSPVTAAVNNGAPAYLISAQGTPLNVKTEFTGGIAASASWTLKQGALVLAKTGKEANFLASELAAFAEAPAVVSLVVSDAGLADVAAREVFKKDYPLNLTRNAVAALVSPVAGDLIWAGNALPISVTLTGFSAPTFIMTIDGTRVESLWQPLEGAGLYGSTIPATLLQEEGVYQLSISVAGNGATRLIPFTLNVYQQRSGIFVDKVPTEVDLENAPGSVTATVEGLKNIDAIQWRSDLSATPIGSGDSLDLAAAGLSPGDRSITVEALSASNVASSLTFPLKVLGAMSLAILPDNGTMIVQQGAPVMLEALARDRDGAVLTGDSITWTSHLDGLLGRGAALSLDALTEISLGEHIFTIKATGTNGATITVLKRVQINAAAGTDGGDQGDGGLGTQGDGGGDGGQGGFDDGDPIGEGDNDDKGTDGFGPGGSPIDPDLQQQMNNFR